MKQRSREVTVFSMSALDLFASALGAFILLTVVFLPFFPNTGDSQESVDDLQQQLEEKTALNEELTEDLLQAEVRAATALEELETLKKSPKIQFPSLDLMIALDTTGSMGDQVESLRNEITQIAKLLSEMSPSVGIGVIDFKDRCDSPPLTQFTLEPMDPDGLRRLQDFADRMWAGGSSCNRDGPEAIGAALKAAVAMPWRGESTVKIIVVITDNPAYPGEEASSKATAAAFAARGPGYQVSAVSVRKGGADYLRDLARQGKGRFVSGGGSFATTLLLALASI